MLFRSDGYPYVTGFNVDAPIQDYLPVNMPNVSRDVSMNPEWSPAILPYRITGEMKNTPSNALEDYKANAVMKGLLTRGQARRGLYYNNVGEDFGSISAVVPGMGHVEPIDLEYLLKTGKYAEGGEVRPEMGAGGNALKAMAESIIKAYHGSPHKFDKFEIGRAHV